MQLVVEARAAALGVLARIAAFGAAGDHLAALGLLQREEGQRLFRRERRAVIVLEDVVASRVAVVPDDPRCSGTV